MQIYYSDGFYIDDIHGEKIPAEAVAISQDINILSYLTAKRKVNKLSATNRASQC